MQLKYDAVVVGAGVVGASTAFYLSKFGAKKVLLIDRGPVCSGGTAKSCAIIRSHYSIVSNTRLTLNSLEVFRNFEEALGNKEVDCGFVNSGYLIVSGEADSAEGIKQNLQRQSDVGAETYVIDQAQARELHPWINVDDAAVIGYEPESGYADPYLTTTGFVFAARENGVEIETASTVRALMIRSARVIGVKTDDAVIHADAVITAIGPWTRALTDALELDLPLEISRHTVLTLRGDEPYPRDVPVVKDLTTHNKMYFRPSTGGVVLVGTGDYGDPVVSADGLDENVAAEFVLNQGKQVSHRMRKFEDATLAASWVGPYDITPDWNPVLGPVSGIDGLYLAFGFSGHGFKLAPAVGMCLAQTVLGQNPVESLHPYRLSRFEEGELLSGTYGIGSIS